MSVAGTLARAPARAARRLLRLVDSSVPPRGAPRSWRPLPLIFMHAGCLLVLVVGVSGPALLVAAALYALRMFAITGFYHRYFSHRAFRTSRTFQFLMAFVGCWAVQRGPLWWAAHHRHHHRTADGPDDPHSPGRHGFLWSHMGWFSSPENYLTRHELVRDLGRYPELRFLDRFEILPPILLGVGLWFLGEALRGTVPGVTGWQLVVWGCFVSTVVLYHATYAINSLAHRLGRRRYPTRDESRNNFWLSLITFGEGWHNNHHHYPGAARQGFYWWEIDLTYYALRLLSGLGLVWDLRPVPAHVRAGTARPSDPAP